MTLQGAENGHEATRAQDDHFKQKFGFGAPQSTSQVCGLLEPCQGYDKQQDGKNNSSTHYASSENAESARSRSTTKPIRHFAQVGCFSKRPAPRTSKLLTIIPEQWFTNVIHYCKACQCYRQIYYLYKEPTRFLLARKAWEACIVAPLHNQIQSTKQPHSTGAPPAHVEPLILFLQIYSVTKAPMYHHCYVSSKRDLRIYLADGSGRVGELHPRRASSGRHRRRRCPRRTPQLRRLAQGLFILSDKTER